MSWSSPGYGFHVERFTVVAELATGEPGRVVEVYLRDPATARNMARDLQGWADFFTAE